MLGGYAGGGARGHVFRTTLGATAWTDLSPTATVDDVLTALDVPFGALALDGSDNVGPAPLRVDSIAVLFGSSNFTVENQPPTPIVISRGEDIVFTLTYRPSQPDITEQAVVRITSNDPNAPFLDVTASATAGAPALDISAPDGGDLGTACLGDHLDSEIMLTNSGTCPLTVTSIVSSRPTFEVASIVALPVTIGPGDSYELAIRFTPAAFGPDAATITIVSDDPASPGTIEVSGFAPHGTLVVTGSACFGEVIFGTRAQQRLTFSKSATATCTSRRPASRAAAVPVATRSSWSAIPSPPRCTRGHRSTWCCSTPRPGVRRAPVTW